MKKFIKKIISKLLPKSIKIWAKEYYAHYKLKRNYKKNIIRLKNKKEKIRVAFLVSEASKWQYQSLYEAMEKSDRFEPFMLLTLLTGVHYGKDSTRNDLDKNYDYFSNLGIKTFKAYDLEKKEYIALDKFSVDIVFYQQPWSLYPLQNIATVSKFALTFYSAYAVQGETMKFPILKSFFNSLTAFFAINEMDKPVVQSFYGEYTNIIATGHPKMDSLLEELKQYENEKKPKKTIIYAPHHSFSKDTGFHWATFEWSGNAVLDLLKKHPDYEWVLKPHPQFDFEVLQNNIMTKEELASFYIEWEKYGKIVKDGNYFSLFAKSDLMITDCGSFISEYFITNKPMIHLSNTYSEKHSALNERILTVSYSAQEENELKTIFKNEFVDNKDSMKEKREHLYKSLNYSNASNRILNYLNKII